MMEMFWRILLVASWHPVLSDSHGSSPAPSFPHAPPLPVKCLVAPACQSAVPPSFGNPSSASKVQGLITFPLDQHSTAFILPGFTGYSASLRPLKNELVRKRMQNADFDRIKYGSVCWFNHRAAQNLYYAARWGWAVACLIPKFLSW